jgi:hypothetical protein
MRRRCIAPLTLGLLAALAGFSLGCGKYGPPVRAEAAPPPAVDPGEPDVGPVEAVIDPGESVDRMPATLGEPVPLGPRPTVDPTGLP